MISRRDIRHLIDQLILELADWEFIRQETDVLRNHPEVIGGPLDVQNLVESLSKISELPKKEGQEQLRDLRQNEFGDRYPSPEERGDLTTELVRMAVFHYLHGQPEGIFQLIDVILNNQSFDVPQNKAFDVLKTLKDYHDKQGRESTINEGKVNTQTQKLLLGVLYNFVK